MDTLCFPVKRADHFMYPDAMFRTKARPTHGGDDMTPVVEGRSEPAYAFDSGVVVIADLVAEQGDSSGIDVMIRSDQTGILGWYGHFSWGAVKRGQRVTKGQFIGYTGNTGNSSGCHLHFEMHYPSINIEIDPWKWIWDAPDVDGSTMPLAPSRSRALADYPNYEEDDMYTDEDREADVKHRAEAALVLKAVGDAAGRLWTANRDLVVLRAEVDGLKKVIAEQPEDADPDMIASAVVEALGKDAAKIVADRLVVRIDSA